MLEDLSLKTITAILTLTGMEVILGIDNIVFISILVAKVPTENRERIRKLGIFLALLMRLILLFSISWIMGLTDPLFSILSHTFSGRDLILILGGLFLLAKSTFEINNKVEGIEEVEDINTKQIASRATNFILFQIVLLDIVFSLDSVITAVGMVSEVWVMIFAMTTAMVIMLFSAKPIGDFVENNPTIKILALSFLLLIGIMLVAEGFGQHIGKGYIYFAMSFSLSVELLNIRLRNKKRAN